MTSRPLIRPQWPDTLVYESEHGRATFETRTLTEPPHVVVPSATGWRTGTPGWMHMQRDQVLANLRQAGCVVVERDGDVLRTLSPDGRLRVDEHYAYDERTGPWLSLSLVELPSGRSLANLAQRSEPALPRFAGPDTVVLSLHNRAGVRQDMEFDLRANTFRWLGASGPTEMRPVSHLQEELTPVGNPSPSAAPSPPMARTAAWGMLQTLLALAGFVFVLGGAWMLLTAATSRDRWFGAAAMVFFGACGLASLQEARTWLRALARHWRRKP